MINDTTRIELRGEGQTSRARPKGIKPPGAPSGFDFGFCCLKPWWSNSCMLTSLTVLLGLASVKEGYVTNVHSHSLAPSPILGRYDQSSVAF